VFCLPSAIYFLMNQENQPPSPPAIKVPTHLRMHPTPGRNINIYQITDPMKGTDQTVLLTPCGHDL